MRTSTLSLVLALASAAASAANTELHQTAFTGTVEAMRRLIDAGADVKKPNPRGIAPLHFAATEPEKVKLLLAAGAEADPMSPQGRTPMMIAAAAGSLEAVKMLAARGANVHARDKNGATMLMLAAVNNHEDVMRYFIDKGVDVNVADQAGFTAMHWAASQSSLETVRLLITKGAKVEVANTAGGKVPRGEVALKGLTPLMLAAPYRPASVVKTLIDAGAGVNTKDVRGMTPLMLAVASENQDAAVVKMLLRRGARADLKSNAGETALDWARKFNHPAVLAALGAAPSKTATEMPPFIEPPSSRVALEKSLTLLEASSQTFFKEGGCFACHHSVTTAMAQSAAASHGHAINPKVAAMFKEGSQQFMSSFQPVLAQLIDPPGASDTVMYMLFGMAAAQVEPGPVTDAMALYLARTQQPNGAWAVAGIARSPIEEGALHRTALASLVLDRYFPKALEAEKAHRLARARRVLERFPVRTTDDAVMKLAGLAWTKAPQTMVDAAARQVMKLQRADGGWSGNPNLTSDAYSTAVAMCALREAGRGADAVERGGLYLLATQHGDGSWHVPSRAPKFQPYFESGFPHGQDQWVSAAATAWAVRALAGLEPKAAATASAQ